MTKSLYEEWEVSGVTRQALVAGAEAFRAGCVKNKAVEQSLGISQSHWTWNARSGIPPATPPEIIPNRIAMFDAWLAKLEARVAEIKSIVAVDDAPPEPSTDVDRVIDQLDRRVMPQPDRQRLRDAVERADRPLTGRAGSDEGLGRAIGRGTRMNAGVRLP